jgi:hypothetical protein
MCPVGALLWFKSGDPAGICDKTRANPTAVGKLAVGPRRSLLIPRPGHSFDQQWLQRGALKFIPLFRSRLI